MPLYTYIRNNIIIWWNEIHINLHIKFHVHIQGNYIKECEFKYKNKTDVADVTVKIHILYIFNIWHVWSLMSQVASTETHSA